MREPARDITAIYKPRQLLILLPVVGILISIIFIISLRRELNWQLIIPFSYGLLQTAGLWLGCMTIVTFLWSRYPWEHHPYAHLIIEVVALTGYTFLFSGTLYWLNMQCSFVKSPTDNLFYEAFTTLLITYLISAIHEAIFFYRQWKYNFSRSAMLEKQEIEARYESLKNQVNPHFMFNSLNSLLSIVDDNPLAVEYIHQLSAFLRYMLQSGRQKLVPLSDEIDMLQKYFYLQKIRFGDNIKLQIDETMPDNEFYIPPLSLQTLVENSLKHNVISTSKPLQISIAIHEQSLMVHNNKQLKSGVEGTGHGLTNLAARYAFFTGRKLEIKETDAYFAVQLPLLQTQVTH